MVLLPRILVPAFLMLAVVGAARASENPFTLRLWPKAPPGSLARASYRETIIYRDNNSDMPRITKVTDPTIEVYLPPAGTGNGTAVVICPGGGYAVLAYDHEGTTPAKWFVKQGVVAVVLKYRLPSDQIMKDKRVGPLQDVQEAIRTVRRRAAEWHVNPARVGVMGFSAGGHLAGIASTLYREKVYDCDAVSARPDFSILIYGVLSMDPAITHKGTHDNLLGDAPGAADVERFSSERHVDDQTPPAFLVHAADDTTVPVANSLRYYEAMLKHHIPGELHIYEKGGHGFSFISPNVATQRWPEALSAWMKSRGLL